MDAVVLALASAALFGSMTVALRFALARVPDAEAGALLTILVAFLVTLPFAAAGELELDAFEPLDDATVIAALVQRRGVGRWSADYLLLRGLGRLHVFPRGDVGALNGLERFLPAADLGDDPQASLARFVPDAGLVYFHLLLRGLEQRGLLDRSAPS